MAIATGTTSPRTTCASRQPSAPNRSSSRARQRCLASPAKPGEPTGIQTAASGAARCTEMAPPVGPIHRRSLAAHRLAARDGQPGGEGRPCASEPRGGVSPRGRSMRGSGPTRRRRHIARRSTRRPRTRSTLPRTRRMPSTGRSPGSPARTSIPGPAIRPTGRWRRSSPRSRARRTRWCRRPAWRPWQPRCSPTSPQAITWWQATSSSRSPTSCSTRTSRGAAST